MLPYTTTSERSRTLLPTEEYVPPRDFFVLYLKNTKTNKTLSLHLNFTIFLHSQERGGLLRATAANAGSAFELCKLLASAKRKKKELISATRAGDKLFTEPHQTLELMYVGGHYLNFCLFYFPAVWM